MAWPQSFTSASHAAGVFARRRAGLFAVSGGALLWGTTGVAVRIVHDRSSLAAVPIGCLRLAIAAAALAVVFRGGAVRRLRGALRQHRWVLVASGAVFGLYQALYFVGVEAVGVSVSTLISLSVAPIMITMVGAITGRRVPAPASLVTLGCAIAGLALISLSASAHSAAAPHPLLGVLASLGSGIGYGASTMLNRRLAVDGDPLLLTAATSLIGAFVLVPAAVPFGLHWPSDATATGWLIYIGLVPTVAAYVLFYRGLRSVSSEVAGVLTLLEPLAAAVLAAIVLHEKLSALGVVGAVLMLAAIVGLYVRHEEPEPSVR